MRLQREEIAAITATAAQVFGPSAVVRLFGSRVDDRRRGGDIELYIEVDPGKAEVDHKTAFSQQLRDALGEQKIDVLLHERGTPLQPIHEIAEETGIVINGQQCAGVSVPDQEGTKRLHHARGRQLRDALGSAKAVARRLVESKDLLAGLFPLDTEKPAAFDRIARGDLTPLLIDGMLKQFENLQDILSCRVFRTLVILEDSGAFGQTMPDILERMVKAGLVSSAEEWARLAKLRNQLAYEYPLSAEVQLKTLNDAFAGIDPLLLTLQLVERYVADKWALDLDGL